MNASIDLEGPTNLPAVAPTGFPVSYEEAREAIAKCESPFECRTMADQAAAMAVYARMRDDTDLQNRAVRLQLWAGRRWGEIDTALHPDRRRENLKQGSRNAADHNSGGKRPASPDGTTEYQRVVSRRLAAIPESEFSRHVESSSPPTVTALAALGTQSRPEPVEPTDATPVETYTKPPLWAKIWMPDEGVSPARNLAAAQDEIRRLAEEVATIKLARDRATNDMEAGERLLKSERGKTDLLTQRIEELEGENEALRERIAIMEVG